jgi:splicing factor 3A subunit 3
VDLNVFHARYLNMPIFRKSSDRNERKLSYIEYLDAFDKFAQIPKEKKVKGFLGSQYAAYLTDLAAYLSSFFERVEPLVDTSTIENMIEADVKDKWAKRHVPGWFDAGEGKGEKTREQKEKQRETESNPLYCTACERLFSKTSVFSGHLEGKKHRKNAARQAASQNADAKDTAVPGGLPVALLEERVVQFAELLREKIDDTLVYLQNKQTRTYEEIHADLQEENADLLLDSPNEDEDDAIISNPLNLPLGWDGKPIPFWLYKLHGLNIEYKCEICGNYTYRGPRSFRRHFREWRHAYGMRCLGIPNTDHFYNITSFKDAIALHKKLMNQLKGADFQPEEEEEFEDAEGHVFNKKTYEDLRRQGIL